MDKQFWMKHGEVYKWDSHRAFNTVDHAHVGCYPDTGEHCDLMIVKCADGRFYIEDDWGGDAQGAAEAFNPYDEHATPVFFNSYEEAKHVANGIIEKVCSPTKSDS